MNRLSQDAYPGPSD